MSNKLIDNNLIGIRGFLESIQSEILDPREVHFIKKHNLPRCSQTGCSDYALFCSDPPRCARHLGDYYEDWRKKIKKASDEGKKKYEKSFNDVYLKRADLSGLDLENVDFSRSILIAADFSSSKLDQSTFNEVIADYACFRLAEMRGCAINEASLKNVDLTQAYLSGASLHSADLSKANCKLTKLHGVRLTHTNIKGARFINKESFRSEHDSQYRLWEHHNQDAFEAYTNIKNYFVQQGDNAAASWASENEMKFRGRALRETKWYFWLVHMYMGVSCGYGEKPGSVIGWATIIIFLFAFIFGLTGFSEQNIVDHVIRFECPMKPLEAVVVFSKSLYFSTLTFTTLGYGDVIPYGLLSRTLASFEALLGAFTMAQLAWVLGRKYSAR